MDKGLALARLNLLLKKQHVEYRKRMNYIGYALGWNRKRLRMPFRGGSFNF